MLQAGRSHFGFPIKSLRFFRSHYGPGDDSAANRTEYRILPGSKDGRFVGMKSLRHQFADCMKITKASTSWLFRGISRPLQGITEQRKYASISDVAETKRFLFNVLYERDF